MKLKAFFLLSALLISISDPGRASSQQPTPAQQGIALLQNSLAAQTGSIVISDITLTGTVRSIAGSDDEAGTATLKALASNAVRLEFDLPSGQHTEVRDLSGSSPSGTWAGPDRRSHSIAYHNLLSEPIWFAPVLAVAQALSGTGYVVTYVGHETIGSEDVEHVTVCQQPSAPSNDAPFVEHLTQVDIYVDSSTLLPAALKFNIHPDRDAGLDIPVEVRYSDYRTVSTAHVPFHVQRYLNNGLVLDLQFQTVTLN